MNFSMKKLKSRKKHSCAACCGINIPIGFNYFIVKENAENGNLKSKWHVECRREFERGLADTGRFSHSGYRIQG